MISQARVLGERLTVAEQMARWTELNEAERRRPLTAGEADELRYLDLRRRDRKCLERHLLPQQIQRTREKLARLEARAQALRL